MDHSCYHLVSGIFIWLVRGSSDAHSFEAILIKKIRLARKSMGLFKKYQMVIESIESQTDW